MGRQALRAAVSSCALAARTVPTGFTAAFPDMAVCWGLCPLDGPVLVPIWNPGDPGHAAGAAVTGEPRPMGLSPGPMGLTGFRPGTAAMPAWAARRLGCSWRAGAQHGQSR
jgi:hypothetical protein